MPSDYKPPSRLLAIVRSDAVFWGAVVLIAACLGLWAILRG